MINWLSEEVGKSAAHWEKFLDRAFLCSQLYELPVYLQHLISCDEDYPCCLWLWLWRYKEKPVSILPFSRSSSEDINKYFSNGKLPTMWHRAVFFQVILKKFSKWIWKGVDRKEEQTRLKAAFVSCEKARSWRWSDCDFEPLFLGFWK